MLKKLLVALVLGFAVPGGVTAVASFAFVPDAQAWSPIKSVKKAAKKVGGAVKKGGKAVGRAAKKSGKAVGRAAKRSGKALGRGGRALGRAAKIVGKSVVRGGPTALPRFLAAVGSAAAKGAKALGRGAKRAGKSVGRVVSRTAKEAAKRTCYRILPRPQGCGI